MKNIYEPEYVKQLFNQMSSSYERVNYITSFGFSIRWRKQFLNKLGKSAEKLNVLDIMSGLGENWVHLKTNFPNACFTVLDFSEQMIINSKLKANRVFGNNTEIMCANVLQSGLPDNNYDIVSCAFGLKTFNEEQFNLLAKEINRILKPGGKFTFVEVSTPDNKILSFFYSFYVGKVIPIFGKVFLGNPEDYKMLWIYTSNFKNSKKIKTIFESHGLNVNYSDYFFGCASGINGNKYK
ncbi:class I SAM-dependent methyltransferase [Flavobacterium dauae]|uniref:class I SAM-dependent methyltransferase n=1 Tax=Flavobacterium dauae TaxID=1563479 RepID=UPI00101B35ED|nr:class I SAM-dependent methyltransferase [Flavobacterium dauae]WLD23906.1 class I SAM-dependent methyltransferase [Flavobacterium dauae]